MTATPAPRTLSRRRVLAPLCVAGSLTAALLGSAVPANADTDATLLNDVGIGNNGAISTMIAQIGTEFCPMIAKQGGSMTKTATSDKGALVSQVAGGVADLAIQSQCPSFMTSLANGDFSVLSNAASMLGMTTPTSMTTSNPLAAPILSAVGSAAGDG